MHHLKFGHFDRAAWLIFSTYAAVSLSVPVVLVQMADDLHFPLANGGMTIGGSFQLARSFSMTIAMLAAGFISIRWGNRRSIGWSAMLMALGIAATVFINSWKTAIPLLMLTGLGEGVVEALCTPFVKDMHEEEPGRYVNFAHGFWSVGTFISVMTAGILLARGHSWRLVLSVISLAACAASVFMLAPSRTVYPEKNIGRHMRSVIDSARIIVGKPRFWIYFAAMIFAGGGEYCLTFWCASFIQLNFATKALAGAAGTAAFSAGMLIGRSIISPRIPQSHLKSLIITTAVFGTFISFVIPIFSSHISSIPPSLRLATLFALLFFAGIGSAPFWPSIQSLCVDRMPEIDSTTAFILLSCAGVPGCGILTWVMGMAGDAFGLRVALATVPFCYALMAFLVWISDTTWISRNAK